MHDYILLMHDDSQGSANEPSDDRWASYLQKLRAAGCLQGGSSIGSGVCVNKGGVPVKVSEHLVGFIRVQAHDLNHARQLLDGNPVFEAGGNRPRFGSCRRPD